MSEPVLVVSADKALLAVKSGQMPVVCAGDYDFKRLLRDAGYFVKGHRDAWWCVGAFSYVVVNTGIGVQIDRVDWLVGQVAPRMTFMEYLRLESGRLAL